VVDEMEKKRIPSKGFMVSLLLRIYLRRKLMLLLKKSKELMEESSTKQ
jgi:hypothetical protein